MCEVPSQAKSSYTKLLAIRMAKICSLAFSSQNILMTTSHFESQRCFLLKQNREKDTSNTVAICNREAWVKDQDLD